MDGTTYLLQNLTPGLLKVLEAVSDPGSDALSHLVNSQGTWSFTVGSGEGVWVWPIASDGALVVTEAD